MNTENKNANRERENAGINYQDYPHQEGQQNNTTPVSGQPSSHNISSSVSEMNQRSGESGKEHPDQKSGKTQDTP